MQLIAIIAFTIILPLCLSYIIKTGESVAKKNITTNVIIVQPNIDPYNEKFDAATISGQVNVLISLSEQGIDSNTRLVLWPETALSAGVLQDQLQSTAIYKPVFDFVRRHTNVTLQTGIESYKTYGSDKLTPTAQFDETSNTYYDA